MKKFILFIAVIIALFCAYWFGLAWKVKTEINAFLTDPEGEMTFQADPINLSGFPLRFKTQDTALTISGEDFFQNDPQDLQLAPQPFYMRAEHISASAPSYNPMRITLHQSGRAKLDYPANPYGIQRYAFDLTSEDLYAAFTPANGGGFKALDVKANSIVIAPYDGQPINAQISSLPQVRSIDRLAFTFKSGSAYAWDIHDLALDPSLLGPMSDTLSAQITQMTGTLSGTAIGVVSGEIDLTAAGKTLSGDNIIIKWGDVDMTANLALTGSARGASGTANLHIRDPQRLIDNLAEKQNLPAYMETMASAMIGAAKVDDNGLKVITLSAKDGQWSWGLIPIWPPAFQ